MSVIAKLRGREGTSFIVGLTSISIVICIWFATLPVTVLVGDDLGFVWRDQHGGPFTLLPPNKFRPIFQLIMAITIPLFGGSYRAYVALNIFVELLLTLVVVSTAMRLSLRNVFVSLSAGLVFAVSRFSYFAILQMGGIMESVAIGFTLLIVYDTVVAYQDASPRRLWRTILWYALLISTDERFVVVIVFVISSGLFYPTIRSSRRRSTTFLAAALAALIFNLIIKNALHIHFLEGSGRELGFDPRLIGYFMWTGLLNIIGFNVGPDYLSSLDVNEAGSVGYVLGASTAIPMVATFIAFLVSLRQRSSPQRWIYVLLALSLFVPLLLSASVSFRQEFRFLYVSYAISVLALAGAAGAFRARGSLVRALTVIFALGSISSAVYYRAYLGNVYFEYSSRIAEIVREQVVRDHPDEVIIVTHGEPTVKQWIFGDHVLFDVYGIAAPIIFIDNSSQVNGVLAGARKVDVFDISGSDVTKLDVGHLHTPLNLPTLDKAASKYSFVSNYNAGVINSRLHQSTPSGLGAFPINWSYGSGTIRSLTVLAGFRYKYSNVPIASGDYLTFVAAEPYSIGIGVRASVDVVDGTHSYRIISIDLLQALDTGPRWRRFTVPLGSFAGRKVAFIFSADPRGDDTRAAWAAFGEAAIRAAAE